MNKEIEIPKEEHWVTCPICESGRMIYESLDNPKAISTDDKDKHMTHMWVCEECPGILMEWYDSQDTLAIAKRLGLPVVKRGDS